MLILSRTVGLSIMIGDDSSITVLGIRGNQVKLGIKTPEGMNVQREKDYYMEETKKLRHYHSQQDHNKPAEKKQKRPIIRIKNKGKIDDQSR